MNMNDVIKNVTIAKALSVSGGNLPSGFSATIHTKIQFSGVLVSTVFGWATSSQVIPLQRVLRDRCKPEFISDLAKTGLVIHANDCGKLLKSRADTVAEFVAKGMPKHVAEHAADNPGDLAEIMASTKIPTKK